MKAITRDNILSSISEINYPESKSNLLELKCLRSEDIKENNVIIEIAVHTEDRKFQIELETIIRTKIKKDLPSIEKLKINFTQDAEIEKKLKDRLGNIKNIIAIGSGKGGVGKSTVAVNLAAAVSQLGYKVGILDADIYGPSIGKMFGFKGRIPLQGEGNTLYPKVVQGIEIISFGFLLDETQPVIWRGPMLAKALEQFLFDVKWGELDFLFIDMPPGTGDVQLSLSQLIEPTGAVIVSTPQTVATLDASRAGTMFEQLKVPVLGIIENMGEFFCPNCGAGTYIFSKGGAETYAKQSGAPFLGSLPLAPEIMQAAEEGKIVLKDETPENAVFPFRAYYDIAKNLLKNESLKGINKN